MLLSRLAHCYQLKSNTIHLGCWCGSVGFNSPGAWYVWITCSRPHPPVLEAPTVLLNNQSCLDIISFVFRTKWKTRIKKKSNKSILGENVTYCSRHPPPTPIIYRVYKSFTAKCLGAELFWIIVTLPRTAIGKKVVKQTTPQHHQLATVRNYKASVNSSCALFPFHVPLATK